MNTTQNINFARTILIVLVVLGHSFTSWSAIEPTLIFHVPLMERFVTWLSTFHTVALTAVSGFTYEYIIENRGGYFFSNFLKKKIQRLLIPFIAISMLWVLPLTSFFVDIDSDYVVNKFILGKSPAQLWFLLMLFDVFIMFYPLRHLLDKNKLVYLVFPLLYYVGDVYGNVSNDYYQFFTSLKYLSYFAIGHLLFKYREKLFAKGRVNLSKPLILSFLVLIHVFVYILYMQDIPGTKTLLMLYLNFGGCVTAMAILFYLGDRIPNNKMMTLLSENSFAIYLFHQQIIYYAFFFLNGLVCPMLHAFVNFAVSLGLSLSLSAFIRRNKFVRMNLLGEKK